MKLEHSKIGSPTPRASTSAFVSKNCCGRGGVLQGGVASPTPTSSVSHGEGHWYPSEKTLDCSPPHLPTQKKGDAKTSETQKD